MTLSRACFFSVALHIALLFSYFYAQARTDLSGLARPPTSDIHARIYTYQPGEVASTQAEPDAGVPPVAAEQAKPAATEGAAKATESKAETTYEQSALDSSPVVLSEVLLEYPAAANNREGVVALEIVVLGTGQVESVRVLKATPAGFFEDAAITGFKNAKFSPGLLGGLGVKSRMEIEVEFMPTNRGGGVGGQR